MGNLSLVGRISLNASPFKAGLDDASKSVERMSSKIKTQIGGAILGFVGGKKLIGLGKELLENAHQVTQLAARFNLTTTEVQQLQSEADKTGESFESLVKDAVKLEDTLKRIGGNEVGFSSKMIEELDTAHKVLKELKDAFLIEGAKTLSGDFARPFRNLADGALGALGLFGGARGSSGGNSAQEEFDRIDAERRRLVSNEGKSDEEALKIEQKVTELSNDRYLEKLSVEQKIKAFAEEAEAIGKRTTKGRLEAAQKDLDLLNVQKTLSVLTNERDKKVIKAAAVQTVSPIGSDSLTSVGNFLGTNANSQGIRAISEGNRILLRIENNTRSGGGSNFPL